MRLLTRLEPFVFCRAERSVSEVMTDDGQLTPRRLRYAEQGTHRRPIHTAKSLTRLIEKILDPFGISQSRTQHTSGRKDRAALMNTVAWIGETAFS